MAIFPNWTLAKSMTLIRLFHGRCIFLCFKFQKDFEFQKDNFKTLGSPQSTWINLFRQMVACITG